MPDAALFHKNGHKKFTMDDNLDPWDMQPGESDDAYHYFHTYLLMQPHERSVRKLLIALYGEEEAKKEVNYINMKGKCRRYKWVERVLAYDRHLAEIDRQNWERRRLEIKELDFQQSMKVRKMVDKILVATDNFIEEQKTFIPGVGDEPGTVIIKQKLDVPTALKGLELANKIQRLLVGESTENVRLSGSALDELIKRELAKMSGEGAGGDTDDEDDEVDDEVEDAA